LVTQPGEAGDLGLEGGEASGGDAGAGGGLGGAAGAGVVELDEVEVVGAAADVLDGEAAGEQFADEADPGDVTGAVLALAGGGEGRRWEERCS
jgi:hypothetical protein